MRVREDCAFSRRDPPKPSAGSPTWGWATCSTASSTTCCLSSRTPRRRALEVALLLEEASGDPVDPRALALAVRGALQLLSETEPLLVAVDDVQWLDPSSASALAFALRRLASNRVLLLFARRLADGAEPSEVEQALDAGRVQRVPVGPLSVGALHRFLRDRLGRPFARQTLLRIHERSGGNPFFALELARVLDADFDAAHPLPVPETLEGLVRGRIAALPSRHVKRSRSRRRWARRPSRSWSAPASRQMRLRRRSWRT